MKTSEIFKNEKTPLMIIFLIGFLLRLHGLTTENLWIDEIRQMMVAQMDLKGLLLNVRYHAAALPLDYLIMHLFLQFGNSEFWVRLHAFIFSNLAVISTFYLARQIYKPEKAIAWIAMILMAISVLQIQYAQEARFYAVFVFLTTLHWWAFFKAINNNQKKDWIIYSIITIVSSYQHFYTLIVLLCHGLILSVKSIRNSIVTHNIDFHKIKYFFYSCLISLLVFLPAAIFYKPHSEFHSTFNVSWHQIIKVLIVGYSVWPGALIIFGLFNKDKEVKINNWFIFLSVLFAGGVVLSLDKWRGYFFHFRQLIFLQPLVLLLMASSISEATNMILKLIYNKWEFSRFNILKIVTGITLSILIFLPALLNYKITDDKLFGKKKPEWALSVQYVLKNADPQSAIFCLDGWVKDCFEYYLEQQTGQINMPVMNISNTNIISEIIKQSCYKEYWFVDGGIQGGFFKRLNSTDRKWFEQRMKSSTKAVFFDAFAVQLAVASARQNNNCTQVDFGKITARSFLAKGWSGDEKADDGVDFVWGLGKESTLVIPLKDKKPKYLFMRVMPIKPQQIKLYVNNELITQEYINKGWHDYKIDLGNAKWISGNNLIEIQYSGYKRSKSDPRARAILWDHCRFK